MDITLPLQDTIDPGYAIGGRFHLLERIGFGGEGIIWTAIDETDGRVVVVKLFPKVYGRDVSSQTDFLQNLDHPYIPKFYLVDEDETFDYICMQYFPGGSLGDLLAQRRLYLQEIIEIGAQITSALAFIHSQNIIHRDLKPSNILLDVDNHAYLTDFGLAKPISNTTEVLHSGQGTPIFASPEQHAMGVISQSSDIYSFGVMLYQMFTGLLPWDGQVALALKQLSTQEDLPDSQQEAPGLPEGLVPVLRKLTHQDPDQRPKSISEAFGLILDELDVYLKGYGSHPTLDSILAAIPLSQDQNELVRKEAEHLVAVKLSTWQPDSSKFPLSLSQFALVDSAFALDQANRSKENLLSPEIMAQGAIVHGINLDHWWGELDRLSSKIAVSECVITNEDDHAVERVLSLLLEESQGDDSIEISSLTLVNRLLFNALQSSDQNLNPKIFAFLERLLPSADDWQDVRLSPEIDVKLASLALGPQANSSLGGRLIGRIRSETALQTIWNAWEMGNIDKSLNAMKEVRQTAGSLPNSIPFKGRLLVWVELVRQQLFEDRDKLTKGYLFAALACMLGLGIHVFVLTRLPDAVFYARILNTLGSGLLFGPIVGLGVLITRLLSSRLKVLSKLSRIGLAILLGGGVVNIGFVLYHILFLGAVPKGWLITLGSLVFVLGFGLNALIRQSRWAHILLSALFVAAGFWGSWMLAAQLSFSPMLFYEGDQLARSLLLAIITALIIGIISNIPSFDHHSRTGGKFDG